MLHLRQSCNTQSRSHNSLRSTNTHQHTAPWRGDDCFQLRLVHPDDIPRVQHGDLSDILVDHSFNYSLQRQASTQAMDQAVTQVTILALSLQLLLRGSRVVNNISTGVGGWIIAGLTAEQHEPQCCLLPNPKPTPQRSVALSPF